MVIYITCSKGFLVVPRIHTVCFVLAEILITLVTLSDEISQLLEDELEESPEEIADICQQYLEQEENPSEQVMVFL